MIIFFFFFDENSVEETVTKEKTNAIFEDIKHVDEYGNEFWYARELQHVLGYSKWSNFKNVIEKAMEACENSGILTSECFVDVGKTLEALKFPILLTSIKWQYRLTGAGKT